MLPSAPCMTSHKAASSRMNSPTRSALAPLPENEYLTGSAAAGAATRSRSTTERQNERN